jgi:hypothetical protein
MLYNTKGKVLNKDHYLCQYLWPKEQTDPSIIIKTHKLEAF